MHRPPIIIDGRNHLLAFHTLAAAEAALAPLDVRNGEYPAVYDSDGRLLRLEVRQEEYRVLGLFRRLVERTRIMESEHIPTHETALRTLLLRFVGPGKDTAVAGGEPLAGLIKSAPAPRGPR